MTGYSKNYTDEIQKIINETKFTNEQEEELKSIYRKINIYKSPLVDVLEDMYKLYINDISTSDIADVYNKNIRTIQIILKKLGLQRDRIKAQSIAVKKRDYVEVRKTYKKTMAKRLTRNQLTGSAIENMVRHDINIKLKELLPHIFVVVGVNTMTDVGELDIPIVIYKDEKLYKFGVEVDGRLFHEDNTKRIKDKEKVKRLENAGYIKIFRINTKAYLSKGEEPQIKYHNEIETKLIEVCNEIVSTIENKAQKQEWLIY